MKTLILREMELKKCHKNVSHSTTGEYIPVLDHLEPFDLLNCVLGVFAGRGL